MYYLGYCCNAIIMSSDYSLNDSDFELLFKEYFIPLCTWCKYKFNIELDVAKEAVHSGFVKVWEKRNSFTDTVSVKAYLNTVITNNCIDILRHEKVKDKYALYVSQNTSFIDDNEALNQVDLKMLQSDINNAIEGLPDQMRRIFELSRYQGYKYAEIAEELNISVKTVETQMSRALAKLRHQLAKYIITLLAALIFLS